LSAPLARRYHDAMATSGHTPGRRLAAASLAPCALACWALALAGCDGTGGLLVINGSSSGPDAGPPPVVLGPASDLVNAGTVAKSKSYKVVYTLGQSSQDQGVETSKGQRLNGGLVGSMNGSNPASDDSPK
jgi:hypothetical protein